MLPSRPLNWVSRWVAVEVGVDGCMFRRMVYLGYGYG